MQMGGEAVSDISRLTVIPRAASGEVMYLENIGTLMKVIESSLGGDNQPVSRIQYPNGNQGVALSSRLYRLNVSDVIKLDDTNVQAYVVENSTSNEIPVSRIKYSNGNEAVAYTDRLYKV